MSKESKKYNVPENKLHSVVNEPMMYYAGNTATALFDLTSIQKMKIIRAGVTKRYLEDFKKKAQLDYDALAKALTVTRATLINKKGNEKFNHKISEQIIALADLYAFGYTTFEDVAHFNQWMFAPLPALSGSIPFDYTDNYYGKEEIKNIIGRIAHGVYS